MAEIAYLLDCYPNITEQFIKREIETLRTKEVRIRIFSRQADRQGEFQEVNYYTHWALLKDLPFLLFFILIFMKETYNFISKHWNQHSFLYLILTVFRTFWIIRRLNKYGIHHIHAHFLGLPAWLAYTVSYFSETTYSLSAHAKDIVQPDFHLPDDVFDSAVKIFFCTRYMQKQFLNRHPSLEPKTCFMPHGLQQSEFTATSEEKTRDIIAIGRLIPKKGFHHLLQALTVVKLTYPQIRMTIYGEGTLYKDLHSLILRNDLAENVRILPFILFQELQQELSRSRLFIHCGVIDPAGDSDGLANTIPEAMAAGVPILVNHHPVLADIFEDRNHVYFTDVTNSKMFADDILLLLQDEKLRNHLSINGIDWVKQNFDNAVNTAPLYDLLSGVTMNTQQKLLYLLEATIGGTQKHLRLLVDALHKKYDIHLVVSQLRHAGFTTDLAHYEELCLPVQKYRIKRRIAPISDFLAMVALSKYLCQIRMDILHFHSSKAGGIGRLAAWVCGYRNVMYSPHAPVFLGCHGLRRLFYLTLERFLNRITRFQIAVSETEKNSLLDSGMTSSEKVIVAPNALPIGEIKSGTVNQIRTIGFLGRLEAQKNPILFLQAGLRYLTENRQITLRIAGSGSLLSRLHSMVAHANADEYVQFDGYLDDTPAFYRDLDLLILPSLWEGNPYTLWEAITAGVIVIASDIAIHREILGDEYPYLFKSNDADDLLQVMNKLSGALPLNTDDLYKDIVNKSSFTKQISILSRIYETPYEDSLD